MMLRIYVDAENCPFLCSRKGPSGLTATYSTAWAALDPGVQWPVRQTQQLPLTVPNIKLCGTVISLCQACLQLACTGIFICVASAFKMQETANLNVNTAVR
jgi:hypothetical protein